jgi:ABC-type transport system involved in multi-copper enzyme maturation permease subunit
MPTPDPPRPGWVGPLFGWELVRLARRGQTTRARGILALIVLLALFLFTGYWFARQGLRAVFFGTNTALSIEESARFGEQFALTFLIAQLLVMIFLTPAYAAGGIAEEKERKTFDFLLTSPLENREIILGKFFGRVVFLLGVLFAGMPILSLTFLYGGVDPLLLFACYALTAGTVAVIAAASMFAALTADDYRAAMFRAYGLTVLFAFVGFGCFYISPLFVFLSLQSLRGDTGLFILVAVCYPLIELIIAAVIVVLAAKRLRSRAVLGREPRRGRNLPVAKPVTATVVGHQTDIPALALPVARPIERDVIVHVDLPPIDDESPLLWKERHASLYGRTSDDDSLTGLKISGMLVLGLVFLISLLIGLARLAAGKGTDTIVAVGTIGTLLYLIAIGADACGRIALERSRQTLESLLSMPVARRVILNAKWHVAVTRGWWWGVPCLFLSACAYLGSELPLAGIPFVAYYASLPAVAATLGLALSMISRSTARAMLVYLPVMGTIAFAPAIVFIAFDARDGAAAFGTAACLTVALLLSGVGCAWFLIREFERDGGGFHE